MVDQTELAVRNLPQPATGEAIDLAGETEDLAKAVDEAREMKFRLDHFIKQVSDELLRRQDLEASWTTRAGEYEIRGVSPAPKVEWDGHDLALTLSTLVEQGTITPEAAAAAVEREIRFKPKQKGINSLLKLGGDIAKAIEVHKTETKRERRVSVRRLQP